MNRQMLVQRLTPPLSPTYIKVALGDNRFSIIDPEDKPLLDKFTWHAHQHYGHFYACTTFRRNKKIIHLRMHRLVAKTPNHQVCHHRNCNSLDNRRNNLENMSKSDHNRLHGYGGI